MSSSVPDAFGVCLPGTNWDNLVLLPGEFQVDQADWSEICGFYKTPKSGDCNKFDFIVAFKSPDVAARYASQAAQVPKHLARHELPVAQHSNIAVEAPPGLKQIPLPFQPSNDCNGQLEAPYEVHIQGLSMALASEKHIEAILEQQGMNRGMTNGFISIVTMLASSKAKRNKKSPSEVFVKIQFADSSAASLCASHFDGRDWGPQKSRVTAWVVSESSAKNETSNKQLLGPNKRSTLAKQSMKAPAHVVPRHATAHVHRMLPKELQGNKLGTVNSDASTTVSDSDLEDERRGGPRTLHCR